MMEWHFIAANIYHGATADQLKADDLYFLDNGELYKGAQPFNGNFELLKAPDYTLPTTPARNKFYINPLTLEGKIYDGTNWITAIKPVVDTVVANGTDPVNSKAVIKYVAEEITKVAGGGGLVAGLSYDKQAIKMTVTDNAGSTEDILLEGIGVSLSYNKATGALDLKDISGNVLGSTVNLDLERFVKTAEYDPETQKIILGFNDEGENIEIDVSDLVDTCTAEDSSSIHLVVTGNKFKAEAIIAATAGNMLQSTADGLFVAATDLSNYQTLVADATADHIATLTAAGRVKDGGVAVGSAALAAAPDANTLATEKAVKDAIEAVKTALTTILDGKMAKVAGATAGNVLTVDAAGQAADSGKKVGGAALAATPNENTLATEKAVATAIKEVGDGKVNTADVAATITTDAAADKVASVNAVAAALSWKTTL